MSVTRRTACKSLLLAPLAGLLSGCDDLGGQGGIPLDIYAKNENITDADAVLTASNAKLDFFSRGLSAGQEALKSAEHVTFPFTAYVAVKSKLIASKTVDENFITNNGARTFAGSQLTMLAYENTVKGKTTYHAIIIAEATGSHH